MSKIEKLWESLSFCRYCANADVFMNRIDSLPFLVKLAGKQINIGRNKATISNACWLLRFNMF